MELIDETRAKDESMRTYITNDDESGDWFAAASSSSSRPLNKSSSDIADVSGSMDRPLVVPWIALLGRKVLAVPATSAAPEPMFSSAGNIMTNKRTR